MRLKKRNLPIALSRKTSLSNAIYRNSSDFNDDVVTTPLMGARTCMKTSSVLEMHMPLSHTTIDENRIMGLKSMFENIFPDMSASSLCICPLALPQMLNLNLMSV